MEEKQCENHCPNCDSDNIDWGGSDVCDGFVCYSAICNECGVEFTENYTMVYAVSVFEKKEPEITVHNNKEYLTVAVFESKRSGEKYKVKKSFNLLTEQLELSCNCKGWIFNKKCKHTKYVEENQNTKLNEVISL